MTSGRRDRVAVIVCAAAAAQAALFTWLSFRKQDAFAYARFDLGNMVQTVWSTSRGRFLEMSDAMGEPYVRLGVHVDPILAAFAPLYQLWSDPKLLLAAQAALVATGAYPAYRLARAELRGLAPAGVAACLAGAWLLYPPVQWATLNELHAVTLAAPLLLFAIWLLRERRYWGFAAAAIAATLCKEQVGLVVGMLGLYAAVVWGDRRTGLIVMGLGFAWSLLSFLVIIPAFTPFDGGPFADRYEAVGGGVGGILATAFTDPGALISEATGGREASYLAGQLAPLLFVALLAPAALVVMAPELAINLLSANPFQTSWRFHYVALQAPLLWWATLLGVRRLLVWSRRAELRRGVKAEAWRPPATTAALSVAAAAALLAGGLVAGTRMGPLPAWSWLPGGYEPAERLFDPGPEAEAAGRAVDRVPAGAPVSVGNRMGAHLSERRRVALFPELGEAEYVVVDLRNASFGEANARRGVTAGDPGARGAVARSQQAALQRLLDSGEWRVVFAEAGARVLQRRGAGERAP